MRALIFNSGLGSRLGALTSNRPKCLVQLRNGESIFHRQLRILSACGVRDFVVTTGPFAEMVEAEAESFCKAGCSFEFVENSSYAKTNYIYSMWLARDLLREGDWLVLHGDLVFDSAYAQLVIDADDISLGSVNAALPLPKKDFKARIVNDKVKEVSVDIFDADCAAFQPFYRLSQEAMQTWLEAVERFVDEGNLSVYAENAANTVFSEMDITALDYEGHFVEEVDTPEDLERVSAAIRSFDFAQQPVFEMHDGDIALADGLPVGGLRAARNFADVLLALGMQKPLIVTGRFFSSLQVAKALDASGAPYGLFEDFNPNPRFEDAARALGEFRAGGYDSLISVGGGSAIDVAKCVKQLAAMPAGTVGRDLSSSNLPYAAIPHVAVPTTAGTGSESTHFAVCYVGGEKVSVANDCLQPDAVLLDASNLAGLPDYQRKCTLLDALCQAIESHWSRRSTVESRRYSAEAITAIMRYREAYLANDGKAASAIFRAANHAGKAINITTTTAPHAMSYKLTSMYGIPHGHSVAMCMPYCWKLLLRCDDESVQEQLREIAVLMTGENNAQPEAGLEAFEQLFASLGVTGNVEGNEGDVLVLASSVNEQRLSNFPLVLSPNSIIKVYERLIVHD